MVGWLGFWAALSDPHADLLLSAIGIYTQALVF
jgi:hypothetical protein